jgi:hypothetical protein
MKYLVALLFSVTSMLATEKDSVICFKKSEVVSLANKIQLIRDSVEYLTAVVNAQDTLIEFHQTRFDLYHQQLRNREQVIDACQKRTVELEKIIQELQPRWYDNKFLWFFSGVGTVLGIMFAVQ